MLGCKRHGVLAWAWQKPKWLPEPCLNLLLLLDGAESHIEWMRSCVLGSGISPQTAGRRHGLGCPSLDHFRSIRVSIIGQPCRLMEGLSCGMSGMMMQLVSYYAAKCRAEAWPRAWVAQ